MPLRAWSCGPARGVTASGWAAVAGGEAGLTGVRGAAPWARALHHAGPCVNSLPGARRPCAPSCARCSSCEAGAHPVPLSPAGRRLPALLSRLCPPHASAAVAQGWRPADDLPSHLANNISYLSHSHTSFFFHSLCFLCPFVSCFAQSRQQRFLTCVFAKNIYGFHFYFKVYDFRN